MINFYINPKLNPYVSEIGTDTQWKIVNQIIRDYRNYVHLKKYETDRIKTKNSLTEQDYESLRHQFDDIISLC